MPKIIQMRPVKKSHLERNQPPGVNSEGQCGAGTDSSRSGVSTALESFTPQLECKDLGQLEVTESPVALGARVSALRCIKDWDRHFNNKILVLYTRP